MNEYLFPNEKIITQSKYGLITLTTHRIRYYSSSFTGAAHLVGIGLGKVSSVSLKTRSKPFWGILAILAVISGAWFYIQQLEEGSIIAGAAAVFFLVLYLVSRKGAVAIASMGGHSIFIYTVGMKRKDQLAFINQVEEAVYQYEFNQRAS